MTSRLKLASRTQEQRSIATKKVLLEAAREAIEELGYAGATSAEIARRAGVSRGAQIHHYANKKQLMLAVADYIWSGVEAEVVEIARELSAGGGNIDKFISSLSERVFSPHNFHPILELITAARHDAELRDTLSKRWAQLNLTYDAAWKIAQERSSTLAPGSRHLLLMTLNLLRGMAFHSTVMQEDPEVIQAQLRVWSGIVRHMMQDGGELKPEGKFVDGS